MEWNGDGILEGEYLVQTSHPGAHLSDLTHRCVLYELHKVFVKLRLGYQQFKNQVIANFFFKCHFLAFQKKNLKIWQY